MVVPIGKDDESPNGTPAASCTACGGSLVRDQRYCFECGVRQGPVPPAFARWLSAVNPSPGAEAGVGEGEPADEEPAVAPEASEDDTSLAERYMPEPRSAAIAVMALLAFGVVIGAATGPIARSAGITPLVIEMGAPASSEEAEPEAIAETPTEVLETAPEATPSRLPPEQTAPEKEGPAAPVKPTLPKEEFTEPGLPDVEHVFLIVLDDHGYEEAFGAASAAPYLAQTLRGQGELLSNYYAVARGDLANEVALLSGQGPTQATVAGCPEYADVVPGTVGPEEQVSGEGCVYPGSTLSLAGQLSAAKKTWKSYSEAAEGPAPEALAGCGPLATAANPFAYFHSVLDSPGCAEHAAGLEQLETDLKSEKTTPSLSYLIPNACHGGAEAPCEPGRQAGLAATQPFLEKAVPEVEASMAYKKSGLIAITFAQAPATGPNADSSACCATPAYPNLPPAPVSPAASGPVKPDGGGGRVGLLLISPFVEAGSSNDSGYFNHFSLLLSIEEAFKLVPLGYAANPALSAFDSTVYNQGS